MEYRCLMQNIDMVQHTDMKYNIKDLGLFIILMSNMNIDTIEHMHTCTRYNCNSISSMFIKI